VNEIDSAGPRARLPLRLKRKGDVAKREQTNPPPGPRKAGATPVRRWDSADAAESNTGKKARQPFDIMELPRGQK
jgi:hypothetical protein